MMPKGTGQYIHGGIMSGGNNTEAHSGIRRSVLVPATVLVAVAIGVRNASYLYEYLRQVWNGIN